MSIIISEENADIDYEDEDEEENASKEDSP